MVTDHVINDHCRRLLEARLGAGHTCATTEPCTKYKNQHNSVQTSVLSYLDLSRQRTVSNHSTPISNLFVQQFSALPCPSLYETELAILSPNAHDVEINLEVITSISSNSSD